jgi:hypothetical protein
MKYIFKIIHLKNLILIKKRTNTRIIHLEYLSPLKNLFYKDVSSFFFFFFGVILQGMFLLCMHYSLKIKRASPTCLKLQRGNVPLMAANIYHIHILSVFSNVIEIAFQITFRAEIHANNVFLFFKNYF